MQEPIRVLQMMGSLNIGGSQAMIINLYKNIDRNKMQFDFIVDKDDEMYYKDLIESLGGKVFVMPRFKGYNLLNIKKAWNEFFITHPEYKILHSHVRSYASIYLPIARKYGLKTIIHSHNTSNGKSVTSLAKRILQFPLRYQADFYFGCSKEAGMWLFGKKIVNSNKYFMLQNAIDLDKFKLNEEIRNKYRAELNIDNNLVFINVGRLEEAKNHTYLIKLFNLVHKNNINTKLLIVGDGSLKESLIKEIKELNLEKDVLLLGNRDDVSNLLQAGDAFIFPSLYEGLPVTLIEAQTSGMPCLISSNISKDVIVSKVVKVLSLDDITSWVKEIENLDYTRKDTLDDITKAGFNVKKTSLWLSSFYEDLLK